MNVVKQPSKCVIQFTIDIKFSEVYKNWAKGIIILQNKSRNKLYMLNFV